MEYRRTGSVHAYAAASRETARYRLAVFFDFWLTRKSEPAVG